MRNRTQHESRLDYQLSPMRNAIEYTSRLLIVEAPDSDWNMTAYLVISVDRWTGGRRVVGWSETWKVGQLGWMW